MFQIFITTDDLSSTTYLSSIADEDVETLGVGKVLNASLAQRAAIRPFTIKAPRVIRQLRSSRKRCVRLNLVTM